MRMRGYGDIIGFQQSGLKNFKIAKFDENLMILMKNLTKFLI